MDFIKKHYEKLILLLMLVLFIFMMIHVMSIARRTTIISDDQLRIPTRSADYTPKPDNAPEFNTAQNIEKSALQWEHSIQREKVDKKAPDNRELCSDLVATFKMARCPHCDRIVPRWCFDNRPCLACGKNLHTPPAQPRERLRMVTESDSDGDGLPNDFERAQGFDPANAADALYDEDRDGFSNLFEFENKKDPKNPRSRPPLWYRLRFVDVKKVELPVRLMAINTMESKDPTDWSLQLNFKVRKRVRRRWTESIETQFTSIGEEIELDGRRYRIAKAEASTKKQGEQLKTIGKVWLEQSDAESVDGQPAQIDKLMLEVDKPVYSNDKRLIVEDIGEPEPEKRNMYVCKVGGAIKIGRKRERIEEYKLMSLDLQKNQAFFTQLHSRASDPTKDVDGKKIIVTKESGIPQEYWVQVMRESEKQLSEQEYERPRRSRRR